MYPGLAGVYPGLAGVYPELVGGYPGLAGVYAGRLPLKQGPGSGLLVFLDTPLHDGLRDGL